MTCKIQNGLRLFFRRGIHDTLTLTFSPITLPYSYTMDDLVFLFYVKKTQTALETAITKSSKETNEIEIDAQNDAIEINLVPDDTEDLQPGSYYWAVRIMQNDLNINHIVPDHYDGDVIITSSVADSVA